MQISPSAACLFVQQSVMASVRGVFFGIHTRENRNAVWECAPFVAAVVSTNYMHLPSAVFLGEL
jgi:hypothetical protein